MSRFIRRLAAATALFALAGSAAAHPGHGTHDFFTGLEHPFGLDHLLAMVAVGVWSAVALPGARRGLGPAAFLVAMSAGALVGAFGATPSFIEPGIALSVVLLGALLAFARQVPPAWGLTLIAASASLHGLAHGAELPAGAGFAGYATGFLLTTAALHAAGLGLGVTMARLHAGLWRVAGALLGGAGLVLLAQQL